MKKTTARGCLAACGGLLLAWALGGCEAPKSDEEQVRERAKERWEALIAADFEKAYGYLTPGSRGLMAYDLYRAKFKNNIWTGARVDEVVCTPEKCDVKLTITYDFRDMQGIDTPITEVWLKADGEWWYVPKN